MTLEAYCGFCLSLPHVTEAFPFDQNTLVFKVGGKIFALLDVENFESINLKCDPEEAIELRESFAGITGGYHMNKKHWNTIVVDGSVSNTMLKEWIDHSYTLVAPKQKKK